MSKLKYGIATVSAIAAFVGVAGLSLPQALAGEHMGTSQASGSSERAKNEYALQKQECDTLKNSQPQAYEPCLQKAQSTRDNLLGQTQGSEQAGQRSQGQFSGQEKQEKGPIDKMTSAVKETVAEVKEFFGSSDQGREGQPGQGQQGQGFAQGQPSQQGLGGSQSQGQSMGQGQQGGGTQGPNPLQQGFEASHMQGQGLAQQNLSAGGGQGGQNFGQQGQQFQGQQGQSGQGQGSFQGGNYGQQPQGQSGQQGTGGSNQQVQSGGTQGLQGSSNQQGGSRGGWAGEEQGAHMDRGEYYQAMARQQYVTLKQECNTFKQDPSVYEQCQKHAESVRKKLVGMAEQG